MTYDGEEELSDKELADNAVWESMESITDLDLQRAISKEEILPILRQAKIDSATYKARLIGVKKKLSDSGKNVVNVMAARDAAIESTKLQTFLKPEHRRKLESLYVAVTSDLKAYHDYLDEVYEFVQDLSKITAVLNQLDLVRKEDFVVKPALQPEAQTSISRAEISKPATPEELEASETRIMGEIEAKFNRLIVTLAVYFSAQTWSRTSSICTQITSLKELLSKSPEKKLSFLEYLKTINFPLNPADGEINHDTMMAAIHSKKFTLENVKEIADASSIDLSKTIRE